MAKDSVQVAKITVIGVIIAATIGAAATIVSSLNEPKEQPPIVIVPPPSEVKQVPQLNPETTASAYLWLETCLISTIQ